jgi:hypothetical protein
MGLDLREKIANIDHRLASRVVTPMDRIERQLTCCMRLMALNLALTFAGFAMVLIFG